MSSVDVYYYLSTSSTTQTGGSWSTTAPTWVNGKYMWSKTLTKYTDGTSDESTPVCITGAKGATGATGTKGDTGVGISGITEYYAISASNTTVPTIWLTSVPTMTATNKYLWNYETIKYTDGSTKDSTKRVIGVFGDKGDKGIGISSITEHYAISTSNTTAPTSWSTSVPTMTATNKYLWSYETIKYTDGSNYDTTKRVIGVYGDKGNKGDKGDTGKDGSMLYATCSTAAATQAKVATLTAGSLSLTEGVTVSVTFTYGNTANAPTLNIAGTGAKAMKCQGSTVISIAAGASVTFTYHSGVWYVSSEPVYGATAVIGNANGYNVQTTGTALNIRNGSVNYAILNSNGLTIRDPSGSGNVNTINLSNNGVIIQAKTVGTDTKGYIMSGTGKGLRLVGSGATGDAAINKACIDVTGSTTNVYGPTLNLRSDNLHLYGNSHEALWTDGTDMNLGNGLGGDANVAIKGRSISDRFTWHHLGSTVPTDSPTTIRVDINKWYEYLITIGINTQNGSEWYYRVLGSTVIPNIVFYAQANRDWSNGAHQIVTGDGYSGGVSYMDYSAKLYAKKGEFRLYAR